MTRDALSQVLEELQLSPADIDDVVLVGGSSRLAAVRARVAAHFGGRALNVDVDPDTAIAIGAARSFGC